MRAPYHKALAGLSDHLFIVAGQPLENNIVRALAVKDDAAVWSAHDDGHALARAVKVVHLEYLKGLRLPEHVHCHRIRIARLGAS